MSKHVAVLMGGWSAERAVSLASGGACAAALRSKGYRVEEIDVGRDVAQVLASLRPDVCFNALHGPIGEDGSIQGLLNVMGIPYTHSGVAASAIAIDKPRAKDVFLQAGLRCPQGRVCSRDEMRSGSSPLQEAPYVIKPLNQGSSVGVHIVSRGSNDLLPREDWSYGDRFLVEEYVPGRELTVGVHNGEAFCVTEITSERGFYDYDAKYEVGGSVHLLPAPLPDPIAEAARAAAVLAHQLLGCRGVTRTDFRYDDTTAEIGSLYILEINTQPGMTTTSLVPEQAEFSGVPFNDLVALLVEEAQCDF